MAIFHDKIIFDTITKKATIMRDGEYLYLAGELSLPNRDVMEPVKVYRPAEEVLKAHKRFSDLQRLPITNDHPESFLDLKVEDSYKDGFADNPTITRTSYNNNLKSDLTVIDCLVTLKDKLAIVFTSGIKELSCGWEGEFEPVDPGKGYEFIQRFKDINHIALVSSGRAGNVCRIIDKKINLGDKKFMNEKIKKILEKFNITIPEGKHKEIETLVKTFKDAEIEFSAEELISLLTSCGIDHASAKEKVMEYLKTSKESTDEDIAAKKKEEEEKKKEEDCNFKKKDADIAAAKEKETKDAAAKVVYDAAIKDAYERGKKETEQKFTDVMPVIRSGDFKYSEIKDKSANEIKIMFIKKILDEDIKLEDPGLDLAFRLAIKNKKLDVINVEDKIEVPTIENEVEKINKELADKKAIK